MAKKKNNRLIILLVLVLVAGAVVVFVIINKKDTRQLVVAEEPQERLITEIVSANGKINPITQVKISPDVSGEIVKLTVAEGDYVEKGQLLVEIKPDTYESMLLRTEAGLNSTIAQREQIVAQLEESRQSYDRSKKLYEQKAITQKEFEQAEASFMSIKAQLKAADFNIESSKATVKESRENLEKTSILAPMSGVVSKLNVEIGERVVGTGQMAGTEMLIVANLEKMEINAEINENDIVSVSRGDSVMVEIDAYPGKVFKGVVTAVANSANQTTSLDQVINFKVDILVLPESYTDLKTEKNPFPLRPGLSTSIDIVTLSKNTLSLPIESIRTKEEGGKIKEFVYVYIPDSSAVYERVVKSGIQDTRFIEIEGLVPSDKVVVAPIETVAKKLKDGMKVRVEGDNKKKTVELDTNK